MDVRPKTDKCKIQLLGSSGVGKTAIITQFIEGRFNDDWDTYYIEDSFQKLLSVDGIVQDFEVIDPLGELEYMAMYDHMIRAASVCMVVYSITNRASFEHIDAVLSQIIRVKDDEFPDVVICGNKCDAAKDKDRVVTFEELQNFGAKYQCPVFETSAYNRQNIVEAFSECSRLWRYELVSYADKIKRPIPNLPPHFKTPASCMRDNFQALVGSRLHNDLNIVASEWEKFKLLCIARNYSLLIPKEIWKIVFSFCVSFDCFSKRISVPAHRCIIIARFPTLMEFIKEKKDTLDLPQAHDLDAVLCVLNWIYCGSYGGQNDPAIREKMIPIAKKLKLYNLSLACQGKGDLSTEKTSFSMGILFNSEAMSDVKLTCVGDGTVILGHKAILSARSSYFRTLLSSPWPPPSEYKITGNGPENLALIRHLYEDTPIEEGLLRSVALLAASRQDLTLSHRFQCQIIEGFRYDTLVEMYAWSKKNQTAHVVAKALKIWIGYRYELMRKSSLFKRLDEPTKHDWWQYRIDGVWEDQEHGKPEEKCTIA